MYQTERPTWYLVVHPHITQVSDLRGKKIGVALIGDSEEDPAGTAMAQREGLRSLAYLGDIFPLPFQGYVTTQRKIAENPGQVKRWIRAMVKSLMFLRQQPEDAAEIATKKLHLRNITTPTLIDVIKSYVRARPQGVPGMPSPDGIKNIIEYEVRLPMKMEGSISAEKFLDLRWVEEVKKQLEQASTNK
jgi:hypothetical protein